MAAPPADPISSTTFGPRLSLTSAIATAAPCSANSRALSAPIPDAPPVTIATLSSSRLPTAIAFSSSVSSRRQCTRRLPDREATAPPAKAFLR